MELVHESSNVILINIVECCHYVSSVSLINDNNNELLDKLLLWVYIIIISPNHRHHEDYRVNNLHHCDLPQNYVAIYQYNIICS